MQEIYFRNADETEARGPYGIEQMLSLAETGAVTAETLIYDATSEQWVPLGTNRELMAQVFPEKKKLTLKAKEFKTLNTPDTNARAITVDEMLAAAEGRTNETADKKNPDEAMMQAARIGMWAAALSLVASAAGEILPSVPALMSADLAKIIARPLVLLGAVDAAFAVMLLLGMVSIYPLLRFRAAFGFGVIGILFYTQGSGLALAGLAAGSAGLYLCTLFTSLVPVAIAAGAGVLGMAAVAWSLLSA